MRHTQEYTKIRENCATLFTVTREIKDTKTEICVGEDIPPGLLQERQDVSSFSA